MKDHVPLKEGGKDRKVAVLPALVSNSFLVHGILILTPVFSQHECGSIPHTPNTMRRTKGRAMEETEEEKSKWKGSALNRKGKSSPQ